MNRSVPIVLLVGLVLVASGCLGGGQDAAAPERATVVSALDNVTTYSFQTNLSTRASLEGTPQGAPGAGTTVTRTRNVSGVVDRRAETLSLEVRSRAEFSGLGGGQGQEARESSQRVYISDGTIYVGEALPNASTANESMRWVRETDQRAVDRYWETREPVTVLRTVIGAAAIADARSATLDGAAATALDLAINGSTYRRIVTRDLGGNGVGGVVLPSGPRTRTTVRNLSITVWIGDDGTPLRTDAAGAVAVAQMSPRGNRTILRQFDATTRYTGHGEPVTVSVPQEALDAPTVAELRRNATRNRTTSPDGATDDASGDGTDATENGTDATG